MRERVYMKERNKKEREETKDIKECAPRTKTTDCYRLQHIASDQKDFNEYILKEAHQSQR